RFALARVLAGKSSSSVPGAQVWIDLRGATESVEWVVACSNILCLFALCMLLCGRTTRARRSSEPSAIRSACQSNRRIGAASRKPENASAYVEIHLQRHRAEEGKHGSLNWSNTEVGVKKMRRVPS